MHCVSGRYYVAMLAVFLAITQAAVPATGETPDNSTRDRQSQNQNADASNNPATDLVSPRAKKSDSPALKPEPGKGTPDRNEPTINVTVPAPVPVPWGVREWFAWGANLALAAVGIGGIVLAICTLKAIK